jgi:FkbM family methyltransferase
LILEELQFRLRNLLRRRGFEVVRTGRPEANLLALHLDRLFDRLAVNVVLDVGAGGGDFGRLLRRNGYAERIASFEPVSDSFDWLRRHSAADHEWEAFRLALGSEDRAAEINVTQLRVFSSFLARSSYSAEEHGEASAAVRTETVPVRRLDGIAASAFGDVSEPRAYLKMDTQGWDLQVLEGASGCLERVVALQSEVSVRPNYRGMPSMRESLERFEQLGFGVSGLFPVALDSNLEVEEFDCVAVRRDAVRKHG